MAHVQLESSMSTSVADKEFEKYKLVVQLHENSTHQLVHDALSGSDSRQIWTRPRFLGEGGFGKVWQECWEDRHGDWHYRAVKICSNQIMQAARVDYKRELSALVVFSKPKYSGLFVNLHGWCMDSQNLFIAMEYLSFRDLSQYATDEFQETEIKEIADNVLHGLKAMHGEGFTHRDIKPQNILVVQKRPQFGRWWVKIADFGFSKQVLAESGSALHTEVVSRFYCAPEILGYLQKYQETSTYSNKVDMWSLGCVIFNISSQGQFAFSEPDLVRYCDGTVLFNPQKWPLRLENSGELFLKALLSADPEERPSAIEALKHHWLGVASVTAPSLLLKSQGDSLAKDGQNYNSLPDSTLSTDPLPDDHVAGGTMRSPPDVSTSLKMNNVIVLDKLDKNLRTALQIAAEQGQVEVVKWLKKNGFRFNGNGYIWIDRTALQLAAEEGQVEVVKWLTAEGADINKKTRRSQTPLFMAVHEGHLEVAKWLKAKGASIYEKDKYGQTPLSMAVHRGDLEVAKWLKSEGASIDEKDNDGRTPLFVAVRRGDLEVAKWLKAKGASIYEKDKSGQTPLWLAAKQGHLDLAKWLKSEGASIDEKDNDGRTPLFVAVHRGDFEVAKWLKAKGASIDEKDNDGQTPLHIAVWRQHFEAAKWLVSEGASIDEKDNYGQTPLFVAVRRGDLEVAKWLKAKGASIYAKDNDGRTPLYVARQYNNSSQTVKWMRKEGAAGGLSGWLSKRFK